MTDRLAAAHLPTQAAAFETLGTFLEASAGLDGPVTQEQYTALFRPAKDQSVQATLEAIIVPNGSPSLAIDTRWYSGAVILQRKSGNELLFATVKAHRGSPGSHEVTITDTRRWRNNHDNSYLTRSGEEIKFNVGGMGIDCASIIRFMGMTSHIHETGRHLPLDEKHQQDLNVVFGVARRTISRFVELTQ